MATSSVVMLSSASMERLYLSQPPAWADLQRLPFSFASQQQDGRFGGHHLIRSCYDKLLHHMYDVNSSTSLSSSSSAIAQLNEQLELAAEYCQLKTLRNGNTLYLHLDQFYVEITFDPETHLPCNVYRSLTTNPDNNNDQQLKEERIACPHMLQALNQRKYRLFRAHLSGYTSLFTLTSPNMIGGNDKRFGYTVYTTLEHDLEQLTKTTTYGKLLQGFQTTCEGLPMRIRFDNERKSNMDNSPSSYYARLILVTSTSHHLLPIKSMIRIDNSTGNIHFDSSVKNGLIASGHFTLEFDENQPPFVFLLTHAQAIARLTGIDQFWLKSPPTSPISFNYLTSLLPKTNATLIGQYQWHISQDMSAVCIRQIPFTHIKQLIHIIELIRQQQCLTKFLNQSFHVKQKTEEDDDDDEDDEEGDNRMDDEDGDDRSLISLEFSLLSSKTLSVTCGQSYRLVTFLLDVSDAHLSPTIIFPLSSAIRQQTRLFDSNNSFLTFVRQILKQHHGNYASPIRRVPPMEIQESAKNENESEMTSAAASVHKLARRLSCGPPAKPAWRTATTLRRTQPACLTLSRENILIRHESKHSEQDLPPADDEQEDDDEDDNDDDAAFLESSKHHQQLLPKPSLSFHPPTLSTCTSVSSTQSVSTPPIFGLSPSTPYPGSTMGTGGNIFFPPAKQVSVHDFSPVNSPVTFASFDPTSAFLATTGPSNSNSTSSSSLSDAINKIQQKKKRRRSEHSNDDFMQTLHDGRPSLMHATKLSPSGDAANAKRGKKIADKNQSQLVRQKSGFKVADSASMGGLQQVASPDDSQSEFKPLKVVIKRVGDGASSSNDESQQPIPKQQQQQQQQRKKSVSGLFPTAQRKMTGNNNNNNPTGGTSQAVLIKSESVDMSDSTGNLSMTMMNDGQQQRERPRPSSSLSNPSSSLSISPAVQPRSVPPQPPIVLKIHRSKVIGGAEQSTSPGASVPSSTKEAFKHRPRSMPSGAGPTSNTNNPNKQHVISPPLLATKLSTPPLGNAGLVATPATIAPSYRIPRKSSSQEVASKIKTEPGVNTGSSPVLPTGSKPALLPTPGGSSDVSKSISKPTTPVAVRPAPPSQIGSWQPPPTQQPPRAHSFRPRNPWPQQVPLPRGRTPITPPNVSSAGSSYPPVPAFPQQPRSILKKAQSSDNPSGDHHFMPIPDLIASHEHRAGSTFAPPPPPRPRTATPPGMYDDNDDDSSPQAQLVIDTSSNPTNNALLPYALLPASNVASSIDDLDQSHENTGAGIPPSSLPSQSFVDDETPSNFG